MPQLLFLDLETTGLDLGTCEVIEVAYCIDGKFTSSLFRPSQTEIPPEVSGVTNIDNNDVKDCEGFRGSDIYNQLAQYAAEGYILVTHNTDFDQSVLSNHGINFNRSICTYKLAWKYLPELANHKLGTLRAYFGIGHSGEAHRAEYDVEILIRVFESITLKILPLTARKDFLMAGQFTQKLTELSDEAKAEYLDIFQFGKYKGKKISEVMRYDRSYMNWLRENTTDPQLKSYIIKLMNS